MKISGTENSEHVLRRSLFSPPYAGSAEASNNSSGAKSDMDMDRVHFGSEDTASSSVVGKSKLKKTVTATEIPSAVLHYSAVQDSCNSKHIDAIVKAAKKDVSTLMKLDDPLLWNGKVMLHQITAGTVLAKQGDQDANGCGLSDASHVPTEDRLGGGHLSVPYPSRRTHRPACCPDWGTTDFHHQG